MGQEFRCSVIQNSGPGTLAKLWLRCQQGCSYREAWLRDKLLLSSLTWLLTRPSSSPLLARNIRSSSRGSSYRQLTTWQLVSLRERLKERKRRQARQKPQSFCVLILEVTSHHFSYSFFLEGVNKSSPLSKGGDYTRAWMPGAKDHW